jgi:hypothetical protein
MDNLIHRQDSVDLMVRMWQVSLEIETLDDEALVEEVVEIIRMLQGSRQIESVLLDHFNGKELTPEQRKECEALYYLAFVDLVLEE